MEPASDFFKKAVFFAEGPTYTDEFFTLSSRNILKRLDNTAIQVHLVM
jgi:hypothetical protein